MRERIVAALRKAGYSAHVNKEGNITLYYPATKKDKERVDEIIAGIKG